MVRTDRMPFFVGAALVVVSLLLRLPSCLASHGCSFVRAHKGQQCVYNIHLTESHGECGGHALGPDRLVMDVQNDYEHKVDTMKRDFTFLKDEHEKRLKELEGTVRDLLGKDSVHSLIEATASDLTLPSSKPRQSNTYEDDNVLTRLHDEFGKLRQALKEKMHELVEVQLRANETEKMLQQRQMDVLRANQELLGAENKIAVLERERAVLKNQLKDRNYKLDVSSSRLTECEAKLTTQQNQLLEVIRSENLLKEELMTCQVILNKTQVENDKLQTRHEALQTRHSAVKNVLSIRERELIDCYSAKTQTFCGFENKYLCGFTQTNDSADFFDWDWGEGGTPSQNTGPTADHTCGSNKGHFMYIEASARGRGKNAILYSPLYRGLVEQCVQFYYHMNGRHIGTLNVYAQARGAALMSVWRAYGNQGDIWSVARLSIPKELARAGYQIAFEGITENGFQGDMAIDDVSVADGPCPVEQGVQTVHVQFNATYVIDDGKNFARNIRKGRLARIFGLKEDKSGRKSEE